jgi:hypothetical protein
MLNNSRGMQQQLKHEASSHRKEQCDKQLSAETVVTAVDFETASAVSPTSCRTPQIEGHNHPYLFA